MKDIIALATIFCLVGGLGMAADYKGNNRPDNNAARPDNHQPAPRTPHNQKAGIYIGADTFGIFTDQKSHKQYRGQQNKMRRDAREDRFGDWYADPNRYHRFKRSAWHKRDCFPVSRHAYDQRGRRVTVGATMCYTRDGRTYIAEGSRRIYR